MKATLKIVKKDIDTIIITDKELEWSFGGDLKPATALAASIFQTVNYYFDRIDLISSNFEIEFSLQWKDFEVPEP